MHDGTGPAAMSDGARRLLRRIVTTGPATRAEIGDATGWARPTITSRLEELLRLQLLRDTGPSEGARGRPAARWAFDASAGRLAVAALGASGGRLAVCDLAGRVVEQRELRIDMTAPPADVVPRIRAGLDALLRDTDTADEPTRDVRADGADAPRRGPAPRGEQAPLWGVAVSLPAPVEEATGTVVSPPIMSGWDGVVVPEWFDAYGVPVVVLNDGDAIAWGEFVGAAERTDNLLAIKVGTGIGAGIVVHQRVLFGAQGAAGDLGHTYVEAPDGEPAPLCLCGKEGCIEAYAGGWAIARDLRAAGRHAEGVDDVVALLAANDPLAVRLVRRAGRALGAGVASAVSLFNPAEIVIAGQLAVAGEHLLAGVRERIAARSLPLATRDLRIRLSAHPLESNLLGTADAIAARVVRGDA